MKLLFAFVALSLVLALEAAFCDDQHPCMCHGHHRPCHNNECHCHHIVGKRADHHHQECQDVAGCNDFQTKHCPAGTVICKASEHGHHHPGHCHCDTH